MPGRQDGSDACSVWVLCPSSCLLNPEAFWTKNRNPTSAGPAQKPAWLPAHQRAVLPGLCRHTMLSNVSTRPRNWNPLDSNLLWRVDSTYPGPASVDRLQKLLAKPLRLSGRLSSPKAGFQAPYYRQNANSAANSLTLSLSYSSGHLLCQEHSPDLTCFWAKDLRFPSQGGWRLEL